MGYNFQRCGAQVITIACGRDVTNKPKQARRARRRWCQLVAIGASAGGLAALTEVIGALEAEFPAIVIVQHLDPTHKSQLANVLARKTKKNVKEAEQGELLVRGT